MLPIVNWILRSRKRVLLLVISTVTVTAVYFFLLIDSGGSQGKARLLAILRQKENWPHLPADSHPVHNHFNPQEEHPDVMPRAPPLEAHDTGQPVPAPMKPAQDDLGPEAKQQWYKAVPWGKNQTFVTYPKAQAQAHAKEENLGIGAERTEPKAGGKMPPGPENPQQEAIVEAFQHAWKGYKKFAWGHDELKPVSQGWRDWFGLGLTIVDSLDTIWIMGLQKEFEEGREWVATKLNFHQSKPLQMFEVVIRELGGLLAVYHLSADQVFLTKATELGDLLLPCLLGPQNIPCRMINPNSKRPSFEEISTAEAGTIQLEFRELSRKTGENKYEAAVNKIAEKLHSLKTLDGLLPSFLSGMKGMARMSSSITVGASADSYYEYLLKQWIQTGKTKGWLLDDYLQAIKGVRRHLLKHSKPSNWAFVGSLFNAYSTAGFKPEMEHLACFLPGTLALGHIHGVGQDHEGHLSMAVELMEGCVQMYFTTDTQLSPEIALFNMDPKQTKDISITYGNSHNLQRPETIESLFYLYRATKDDKYRQWGWKIFQAFEKHTRVANGYVSISNVKNALEPGPRDKMETFYLAETLKYLYLLFSDDPDLIRLDQYVINTEAHPLPIYNR